jgi:organic radical activating enzyme
MCAHGYDRRIVYMDDNLPEMPFLRNIGFVMTYKCQVSCPHCIINAGPHRKEEMSLADAFDWIRQISAYRNSYIKVLSLTGGEPFYNFENLKKISSFGEEQDLLVSVVTNAFWASTIDQAVKVLKELPAIKMLAISTDAYHQESIPFEKVKNAVYATKVCDIPYNIAVCTENEEEKEYKKILSMLYEITEPETVTTAVTFPAGRALERLGTLKHHTTEEPPKSACSAGSSPMVFPSGKVIACIGPVIDIDIPHPLMLGNLRDRCLDEILDDAELNPILHAIRIWGPRKLISILRESGLVEHLPDVYVKDSVCNACYNLMSNSKITEFLTQLAKDSEFAQKVAYGRAYYLNETRMAELLHLAGSEA